MNEITFRREGISHVGGAFCCTFSGREEVLDVGGR
jgi:hypothetical protein